MIQFLKSPSTIMHIKMPLHFFNSEVLLDYNNSTYYRISVLTLHSKNLIRNTFGNSRMAMRVTIRFITSESSSTILEVPLKSLPHTSKSKSRIFLPPFPLSFSFYLALLLACMQSFDSVKLAALRCNFARPI